MGRFPKRTGSTGLTGDELILFDVMFDSRVEFKLLRRPGFSARYNYHCHNLDDEGLSATLQRFLEFGLVSTELFQGKTYFQLAPRGGQVWEMERQPPWERYATERYGEWRNGKPFVAIRATTPQTRDDFWRIGCDVAMFAHSTGRVRKVTIENHELIPWKRFDAVYVTLATLDDSFPVDNWRALEERRTWWRCVSEIDKFWESGAA
jgi:hypothetical protein